MRPDQRTPRRPKTARGRQVRPTARPAAQLGVASPLGAWCRRSASGTGSSGSAPRPKILGDHRIGTRLRLGFLAGETSAVRLAARRLASVTASAVATKRRSSFRRTENSTSLTLADGKHAGGKPEGIARGEQAANAEARRLLQLAGTVVGQRSSISAIAVSGTISFSPGRERSGR